MFPRITPAYKTNSAPPFSKHSLRANPGDSLPLRLPGLPHPHPHLSKKGCSGNSLVVQWLRPHASTAGNMDLIRGGKTKNPHAISESESRSVVSNSLRPHGLYSPWNSLHQDTGVGSLSLLQGIFPTQGSNPGIPHCRQILYQLSHKGLDMAKKKSCSSLTPLPQDWGGVETGAKEGCRFPSERFTLRSSQTSCCPNCSSFLGWRKGQV